MRAADEAPQEPHRGTRFDSMIDSIIVASRNIVVISGDQKSAVNAVGVQNDGPEPWRKGAMGRQSKLGVGDGEGKGF